MKRVKLLFLLIPLIALSLLAGGHVARPTASAQMTRPSIILITTDDQNVDSLPVMRHLMSYPYGSWVQFTAAFTNESKCCPSRSAHLTGQYSHHHGVTSNGRGKNLDDRNTLATWLDAAGYRTGLIGKYLIRFPWGRGRNYVPPGWDYWNLRQGTVDMSTALALDFINQSAGSAEPFFLWLAYTAPHHTADPGRYANQPVYIPPNPPNFNEVDVSDKPLWIRQQAKLSNSTINTWAKERANSQRELMMIDDGVKAILDQLAANGQLENTVVIFDADHGFSWGAHRWIYKNCAYEECNQFPLLIRYPGLEGNRTESRLVSNIDLAPTIAEIAEATPGRVMDGRSLMPLLLAPDTTEWQRDILLEKQTGRKETRFWGIRTEGFMYAEYTNGDKELYDLTADPYELENMVNSPDYAAVRADLAARLQVLKSN